MDAIENFITHVTDTSINQVPDSAIRAAKTFILDSLGVGLSGGNGPWVSEMIQLSQRWGQGSDARVWGHGQRLPAPAAAMCNAYQIHNAEFDCVHEGAVVHSMTVLLGAALAVAERDRGVARRLFGLVVAGRRPPRTRQPVLIAGVAVGEVTSGNFSPGLGRGIALAFLPPETQLGAAVQIEARHDLLEAEVVKPPFVP